MKQALRRRFRDQERNRPADEVTSSSRAIFEKLAGMEEFQRARCVGAYLALPSEVQTDDIIRACWDARKQVCVPYFIPGRRYYGMCRLDRDTPVRTMRFNLREPEHPEPVNVADLDLILVPALAFDREGMRLGHGGGHYDRLMVNVTGFRLGLAFHEQVVDQLPREPHDQSVDAILTEQKLFRIQ